MKPLPGSPEPPAELESAYGAWGREVACQYGPEVLTYRLTSPSAEVRFLKLARGDQYPDLQAEGARMTWAMEYLPVPKVLAHGSHGDIRWLITSAVPGTDATDPGWKANPKRLVPLLAEGLRLFHTAPVRQCPFDFRLEAALAHIRRRLEAGQIDPERDFHPEFEHLSAAEAVRLLESTRPSSEQLVVCHGDYCLPNVLIEDGEVSGFVDLGELGVADLWWDLAVATWSLTWNLGPGYEDLFLEHYGIDRNEDRVRFYRLLYDLVS